MKKTNSHKTSSAVTLSLLRLLTPRGQRAVLRSLACPMLALLLGFGSTCAFGADHTPADLLEKDSTVISEATVNGFSNRNETSKTLTMDGGKLTINADQDTSSILLGTGDSSVHGFAWTTNGGTINIDTTNGGLDNLYTINADLANGMTLTKEGAGALSLTSTAASQNVNLNVTAGTLQLAANLTNTTGTVTVDENSTLTIKSTADFGSDSTLTVNDKGDLLIDGGTATINSTQVTVNGDLVINNNGSLTTSQAITFGENANTAIVNGGKFESRVSQNINGAFTVTDGGSAIFQSNINNEKFELQNVSFTDNVDIAGGTLTAGESTFSKDLNLYNNATASFTKATVTGTTNIIGETAQMKVTNEFSGKVNTLSSGSLDLGSGDRIVSIQGMGEKTIQYEENTFKSIDVQKDNNLDFVGTNAVNNQIAVIDETGEGIKTVDYGEKTVGSGLYIYDTTGKYANGKTTTKGSSTVQQLTGEGNLTIKSLTETVERKTDAQNDEDYLAEIETYNGTMFIADGTNNKDAFSNWNGTTTVTTGTLALKGNTTFGSGTNDVFLSGTSFTGDNDSKVFNMESASRLAFFDNSTLRGNEISLLDGNSTFKTLDGKEQNLTLGSQIWLNASDTSANDNLGTIQADTLRMGENTEIWVDGITKTATTEKRTFTIEAKDVYDGNGTLQTNAEEYLNSIVSKVQLQNNTVTDNKDGSYSVTIQKGSFVDWTVNNNCNGEYRQIAQVLDNNSSLNGGYDAVWNTTDGNALKSTLANIAAGRGITKLTEMSTPLTTGTGPWSGGAKDDVGMDSVGGAMAGLENARRRGQDVRRDDENPVKPGTAQNEVTNNNDRNRWTAWASFSHTSINGYGYQKGDQWIDGYDIRRTGVLTGLRQQLSDTFSMGLLFSYSGPQLNQNGMLQATEANQKTGRYFADVDMADYQFAFHCEKKFGQNWTLSTFVSGGAQTIDWNRRTLWATGITNFDGDTTGNSLGASLYLTRRLEMSDTFSICPTLGIDTEHSWIFGFSETTANEADYNKYGYNYKTIKYDRQTLRFGSSFNKSSYSGMFGGTARAFYGRQIGGADAASVSMTLGNTTDTSFTLQGHEVGRDSWNLGTGAYAYLNQKKTLSMSADYSAIFYRNATMQNITAGIQWRF